MFRAHHRRCADNFLTEINIDIDQTAEVDSALFWKKINCRKKFSSTEAGCEMKFGTRVCRDPDQIVSDWGDYFKDLYTDTERPHYDSNFQREVDTRVKFIKEEIENERDAYPIYISM